MNEIGHKPVPDNTAADASPSPAREFLRVLRRRRAVVIGTFVLIMTLTALVVSQLEPVYRAEAKVLIERKKSNVAGLRELSSELVTDTEAIANEIEVIRSQTLAEIVVDRLALDQSPEFNAKLRPPSLRSVIAERVDAFLSEPWIAEILGDEPAPALRNSAETRKARIVSALLSRLKVERVPQSRVIVVKVRAKDPQLAATVANTVVTVYSTQLIDLRRAAAEKAERWLSDEVESMRKVVTESERAAELFRIKSDLMRGNQVTLLTEEMSELNRRVAVASAARAEAQANLREITALVKSGGAYSAEAVLNSYLIQQLRIQEAAVLREVAELSVEHGPSHPKIVHKKNEIRELRENINGEIEKLVGGYSNALSAATAREASLQAEADKVKAQLAEANKKEVQLRALEREAEANRRILETLLVRLKETAPQTDGEIQLPNVHILSNATLPQRYYPKDIVILVVAGFASIVLGALLAQLVDHLDSGFRSVAQLEDSSGIPVLALLPVSKAHKNEGLRQVAEQGSSPFAEAVRTAYTRLVLRSRRPQIRSILVTSSMPQEGKSTLAVSLANMRALAGHRVILVEADLRRPALHRYLGTPRQPGLTDVLRGEAKLEDVVVPVKESGAFVIPAGKAVRDPADLLASEAMAQLLSRLTGAYELVIVDSPPVMSVADACGLAGLVEHTLFVVRWGRTAREVVSYALNKISDAKGPPNGIVLSMVDPKKISLYGYGEAAYYSRMVQKYYQERV
jgi:capsular exopolysaccharide synthesis family protein